MFDLLLQEVAKKFGLGNKASWILSTLLGLMFNRSKGGMSGFLDKLTQGGMGKIVNSWLGKGEPMAVNATQIESAIDSNIISNLASKLGLASGPVGLAIAHMLPKVVSALTPDGVIPDSIPASIANYIKDEEQVVTETEIEPEPEIETQTKYQREEYKHTSEPSPEGSGFKWWWLLLPLFLLLGWCTLRQPEEAVVPITEPAPVVVPEPAIPEPTVTPVPNINSSLSVSTEADSFNISGVVANDATKESILTTLNSIVGSDKVNGDIFVDATAKDAGWQEKLSEILPVLKDLPGARLKFDGNDISLDGVLEQGMIDGLMEKLKGIFGSGDFNISSQAVALAPTPEVLDEGDATETDENALKNMVTSGTVTGESLVSALNVAGINFATGSFNITTKSMTVLSDAAEAIKLAPADIQIQVGGHTDNTGSSQINSTLSGQRAQAVVDALVGMGVEASKLSAKGFGDSQPVADNNSEEGRAQNRRMEFTLQQ